MYLELVNLNLKISEILRLRESGILLPGKTNRDLEARIKDAKDFLEEVIYNCYMKVSKVNDNMEVTQTINNILEKSKISLKKNMKYSDSPITTIYLSISVANKELHIINGQHRINWIESLYNNNIKLNKDVIPLPEFNGYYSSLPKNIREVFESLIINFKYSKKELTPEEECKETCKRNTNQKKFTSEDKLYAQCGYVKSVSFFRNFGKKGFKNNLKDSLDTDCIFEIPKFLKKKSFLKTVNNLFFRIISYSVGFQSKNDMELIKNLIIYTKDYSRDDFISLFEMFGMIIKKINSSENSYLRNALNEEGNHVGFALCKKIYMKSLEIDGVSTDIFSWSKIPLVSDETITKAFNLLNFKKISKYASENNVCSSLNDTAKTDIIYHLL